MKAKGDIDMSWLELEDLHAPVQCTKCGEYDLKYKGLGEYFCEKCENSEFDDYGKVRNYLDVHKGTPITIIARDTGVSKTIIRKMVESERFDICPSSKRVLK